MQLVARCRVGAVVEIAVEAKRRSRGERRSAACDLLGAARGPCVDVEAATRDEVFGLIDELGESVLSTREVAEQCGLLCVHDK